jgi:CRP/FNR family cyclic AMP-dependent transcriptional regulator
MATCFAPMPITAPRIPLGRSFPLPAVARPQMNLVVNGMTTMPRFATATVLRNPLDKFMAGKTRREYTAGESIFSQGDSANAVFYIQSGRVNLTVVSMNGKEAIIAQLPEGSFFGEASLAGEQIRTASASSLQASTIVRIADSVMLDLLRREPEFAEHFRVHLLTRNSRMEADLVDHLFNSSEKRLARLLMLMANFGQDSKPTPDIAKISQETLAEMIGTTRSRVSFFLNRFRDLGYINYNCGGMCINSSLINVVLQD